MSSDSLTHVNYHVGWICALPKEQTAATAMLDKRHDDLPKPANDPNTYTLGSVGKHNIVITCLPKGKIGLVPAATVAAHLVSTFPSIKFGLMVGIGGGIPPKVRLGDVVVSTPIGTFPGVVQWDFGKAKEGGNFERTGALNNPPTSLLTALTKLETEYELNGSQVPNFLEEMRTKWPRIATKYLKSDSLQDVLFKADYPHVDETPEDYENDHDEESEEESCRFCDKTKVVKRRAKEFRVHHGLIASGNQVIKDALFRDRLNKDLGGHVLCVEMEAAGLSQDFPCLIIRGICDYADSHKNKEWQEHAAATAAAFAKELLVYVQPNDVDGERPVADILREVRETTSATHQQTIRIESKMAKDEDMRILNSLTTIDYTPQQKDFFDRRQPGTGQWFLESPQFQNWLEVKQQTLFCPGIPGAGKTILASIIIDDLVSRFSDKQDAGIAYIYCNFQQHSTQSAEDMIKSLLKQLAQGLTSLPDYVKDLCVHGSKIRPTTLRGFSEVLERVAKTYSRVFIIIDGLDECETTDNNQAKLLTQLSELQALSGLNLLATSRSVPQITDEVKERFENVTSLEIHAHDQDIRSYLAGAVSQLPKIVSRNPSLQEEVITKIIEAVDGMFLLAQLHLESLRGKRSVKSIRTALKNLKTGSQAYDHAYLTAMQRIKGQVHDEEELAIQVLMWVTNAMRPLHVQELQTALAVEVASEGLDEDNLSEAEQMVSVCAGLVTIDRERRVIRLVHYTTQEYLQRTRETWFPTAHEDMMRICITYLSYKDFFGQSSLFSWHNPLYSTHPLLSYAMDHWGNHARNVPHLSSEVVDFLECDANVQFTSGRLEATRLMAISLTRDWRHSTNGLIGLHLAARFGLEREVEALIQKGFDVDAQTPAGETPLWFAIERHHTAVVAQLLERGASYKISCGWCTPLIHAILRGFEDIAKILINKGAGVYKIPEDSGYWGNERSQSPLAIAAHEGNTAIVKMLLSSGADPHLPVRNCPLGVAADKGHDSIVKILLENGAHPEFGYWFDTPLAFASKRGHETTVKILLDNGANVNSRSFGITPLMCCTNSQPGNAIFNLLLEKGADIEARDNNGKTPLMLSDNIAKVKLLLENGADIEARDDNGKTPLMLSDNIAKAKLLLEQGANITAQNHCGETPLVFATRNLRATMALALRHGYEVPESHLPPWRKSTIVPDIKTSGSMVVILVQKDMPTMRKDQVYIRSRLSVVIDEGFDPVLVTLLESGTELDFEDDLRRPEELLFGRVDILIRSGASVSYRNWISLPPNSKDLLRSFTVLDLLLENGAETEGICKVYPPVHLAQDFQKQIISDLLLDYGVKNISQTDLIDCT